MKLIDLLVKELPKRGGWPGYIRALAQSSGGYIYQAGGGFPILKAQRSDDWELAEVTRAQYESALADSDGWIEWGGGECPVKSDSIVDIRFRAGKEEKAMPAYHWHWKHDGSHSDIIAYRPHRDINSRANDDRLEQDLNECIGQDVDVINHPSHYTLGSVECIDAIASATVGKSGIEAVCVANAIKYLWRYEEKNGIEDVKKAAWYLNKLLSEMESK